MTSEAPLLEVQGLSVAFGGVRALDDVALAVEAGSLVGLLGANGAGKTTLIEALTGFVAPSAGQIGLFGRAMAGLPPHARARAGLARTFQAHQLFDDLTVRENVMIAVESGRGWRRTTRRSTDELQQRVDSALGLAGARKYGEALPGHLSHGQRSLVSVARALAGDPAMLLLDEPAAGLDERETEELARRIRDISASGVTVLLVDHDTSLVLGICDPVHVLDHGCLIASGTPSEVREDPLVIEAYLGAVDAGPDAAAERLSAAGRQ